MRRFLRDVAFAAIAVAMFTLAGLPWVLMLGADVWWSPIVGFVALAVSK